MAAGCFPLLDFVAPESAGRRHQPSHPWPAPRRLTQRADGGERSVGNRIADESITILDSVLRPLTRILDQRKYSLFTENGEE